MTVKLNLTIDENIVAKSKRFAAKQNTSVSKLVEDLLAKAIIAGEKSKPQRNFVEQYAATLSGKLSNREVKKIKDEYLMKKYGH